MIVNKFGIQKCLTVNLNIKKFLYLQKDWFPSAASCRRNKEGTR